jgi:uncharacterized protein with von Willebrand factor type A (vWA) domain
MDRSPCFDVPKHHANLWRDYGAETSEPARVAKEGDERAAGFGDGFMPELFHRLYAETPRETPVEDKSAATAVRAKLHSLASELPEFETLRKQTVRDPLWAGMAACALSENVSRAMPVTAPSTPDADRAQAILEGLLSLADDSPEAAKAFAAHVDGARSNSLAADHAVAEQAAALSETAIRQALRAGIVAAQGAIDDAQSTLAALGWGSDIGSSASHKSPGVAVELARRVRSSATLKRIVELAGRMIMTSRAKRAARTEYARSEVVGVEQTGDVSRLLPSELVALTDPLMTAALYRRMLERAALGYRLAGSDKTAKGPIVIAIDQSGSMEEHGKDEWAKAVALALLDAARSEGRIFGVILYNAEIVEAKLFPKASEVDPRTILDLLSRTPAGGTNFGPPMTRALDWISTAGSFSRADIVHITDGDASRDGAEAARTRAKAIGVQIFGVAIGAGGSSLAAWSDEVAAIRDVSSDTAAVDLIFDSM